MLDLCTSHDLLRNTNGIIRLPFLIKGNLIIPPVVSREQIEAAFHQADHHTNWVKLAQAQVVRQPVIDRSSMKYSGDYVYHVMPPVDGRELIEIDIDQLVDDLYSLTVADIIDYLETVLSTVLANRQLLLRVQELYRASSELPDLFLDNWLDSFNSIFNRASIEQMIDADLSFLGYRGSDLVNGWQEIPTRITSGWLTSFAKNLFGHTRTDQTTKPNIRAMPTRQLHITAGNAPEVPLISVLRSVLTKSAAVIKLPHGATLTGALFSLAAVTSAANHPITKHLSMVYWPGGDKDVEQSLFKPGAFDRIVVWGNPETVMSVQSRAPFTRVISLNPRYGVSLVGNQAFSSDLEVVAVKASTDVMIHNQKACTSSLVHYIEGTLEQAELYAKTLCQILSKWDMEIPNFVTPSARGQIKQLRRGKYAADCWYINNHDGDFSSGVVVIAGEFDILDHPMCRLVVIRPVTDLVDALKYMNQHVSTAGVYPEQRRLELRDRILARGVSNLLPLGECARTYTGMPHDGMRVLNELVDWKNA